MIKIFTGSLVKFTTDGTNKRIHSCNGNLYTLVSDDISGPTSIINNVHEQFLEPIDWLTPPNKSFFTLYSLQFRNVIYDKMNRHNPKKLSLLLKNIFNSIAEARFLFNENNRAWQLKFWDLYIKAFGHNLPHQTDSATEFAIPRTAHSTTDNQLPIAIPIALPVTQMPSKHASLPISTQLCLPPIPPEPTTAPPTLSIEERRTSMPQRKKTYKT